MGEQRLVEGTGGELPSGGDKPPGALVLKLLARGVTYVQLQERFASFDSETLRDSATRYLIALERLAAERADAVPNVPRRAHEYWSPDEEALLWTMFQEQRSLRYIAEHLGRSVAGVEGRLKQLQKEYSPRPAQEFFADLAAELANLTPEQIASAPDRRLAATASGRRPRARAGGWR